MSIEHPTSRQDRLFTLRTWTEEVAAGEWEWRGRIYDTTTGEVRHFRDWSSLLPLLFALLRTGEQPTTPEPTRPAFTLPSATASGSSPSGQAATDTPPPPPAGEA